MKNFTFYAAAAATALLMPYEAFAQTMSVTTSSPSPRQVTVTAITDNIIKVTNCIPGEQLPPSETVILNEPQGEFTGTITRTSFAEIMETATGVVVSVNPNTGAVAISAGKGRTLSDNGLRISDAGKQTLTLTTSGSESFYGAGERGFSLNLANDTLVMFNKQNYGYTAGEPRIKQMNISMPLIISSNGYALLFDDYAAAELITGNPLIYTTESRQPVSYYFISGVKNTGQGFTDLIANITRLTGRQPLPPLWSLGYITSKYGYRTQDETLGVVDTLKQAGYPVDGIVLDLYWYGKEQDMGRLDWDSIQWPDHRQMLADLKDKGVNLIAISQPYVLRNGQGAANYSALSQAGMLVRDSLGNPGQVSIWVGDGGMLDVSNPDTRQWLAQRYRQLTDDGITGWWGDLGEPEVHPDSLVHFNGLKAREYHNLYGNDWSEIIFDMFRSQYPDRRLMTMMRGGTTGLQRYSVFPWSTDVSRSWGGLKPQVTIMLNSGLSGLGYMSHDVGGFAIDPDNPVDPELYVRWLQLGLFSPILRTHAQQTAEPYKYPEYQDIILPIIRERYAWLPYNYTLAYKNAAEGLPLVRPLNFYEVGETKYDGITDEFLWGDNVLVAPVMTKGATSREIVFPSGQWIDITDSSARYDGNDTITYSAPLDVIPLFVRAGSFIPRADYHMDNTGDYSPSEYTVRFYATLGKSSGELFEDDMTTPTTLSEGRYTLLKFASDVKPESATVNFSAENGSADYNNPVPIKKITLEVYGLPFVCREVSFDGKKTAFSYDESRKCLIIPLVWDISATARLHISQ